MTILDIGLLPLGSGQINKGPVLQFSSIEVMRARVSFNLIIIEI